MAYFAEINSENLVLTVVVADDIDIENNGGHSSEEAANVFKRTCSLSINGVKWIETFKEGTRGQYAGIGYSWNEEHQIFCEPKIYESWSLNTTTGMYEAPITKPTNSNLKVSWDEDNLRWQSFDYGDTPESPEIKNWNPDTSTWS